MKIVTILGARPQFIKAAPVCRAFRSAISADLPIEEFLLHTGQHYDREMSQLFFDDLGLPKPDVNLGIGGSITPNSHGSQTGTMLIGIEAVLDQVKPDWVLVYGDTNSTLAGALAAVKLNIPVAHVEAGLRSFNRRMPEEHNRVLTDHCAELLFCPTQTAVQNLQREGLSAGVYWTGDVMYDAALQFGELASQHSKILRDLGLQPRQYLLLTLHRAYNTDDPNRLRALLAAMAQLELPVIWPLHPRTRKKLAEFDLLNQLPDEKLLIIPPVGYLDMLSLEQNALRILTDSGGVQKEAYFYAVPCITLRPETEWIETVQVGWNRLVDINPEQIIWAASQAEWPDSPPPLVFGSGEAANEIVKILLDFPIRRMD